MEKNLGYLKNLAKFQYDGQTSLQILAIKRNQTYLHLISQRNLNREAQVSKTFKDSQTLSKTQWGIGIL